MAKKRSKIDSSKETRIQAAIKALNDGVYESLREAAEAYDIAKSTLYYRYKGERTTRQLAHSGSQFLLPPEESAIVCWCKDQDDRGFPPRYDLVREMALHLYFQQTGDRCDALGKNWVTRFLDRHPDLAAKFSQGLVRQRALASNPRVIKDYFSKLLRLIRRHNLKPHQIFNMDEKGFVMGKPARAKVICRRSRRNPKVTQDSNRELITVIEFVSACGKSYPPMVINKGKAHYMGWFANLTEEHTDYRFSFSPKGWTDVPTGLKWLTEVFEPCTANVGTGGIPRLLILDGHGSHMTFEFMEFCRSHNILLFCLPAHSTHLLQPLNVGVFGSLQHFYGKAIDDYIRTARPQEGIKRSIFLPLLHKARTQALTSKNIQQAFATTGIQPFNSRHVYAKMKPEERRGTSNDDTPIQNRTPMTSREIRGHILAGEKLINTAASPRKIKAILRQLGHTAARSLADKDLAETEVGRLRNADRLKDKTDKRKISTAKILVGDTALGLVCTREEKDSQPKGKQGRKKKTSQQLPSPPPLPPPSPPSPQLLSTPSKKPLQHVTIRPKPVTVYLWDSDDENLALDLTGEPEDLSNREWNPSTGSQKLQRNHTTSQIFPSPTRQIPSSSLRMSLRSRKL